MKENKKSNNLVIILIVFLFTLIVGQLYLMNNIDSYSYNVQNLVSEYNSLNIKNQNLQTEISSNQSIVNIRNNVLGKGYKNVNNINYLPQNAYSFNIASK